MTTPTHLLTGAVIAKLSMDLGFVPYIPPLIYPIGMLAANLPDLDVLFIKYPKNHRTSILHVPLFWAVFLTLWYVASSFLGYTVITNIISMISIAVVTHFCFDTFDMSTGIAWLAPWNKTFFSILPRLDPRPETIYTYMRAYMKHPVMVAEGVVVVFGIIAFLKF